MESSFAPGYKLQPYWWDATPRPELPRHDLPRSVDAAVVGSGYTGLHAALELARGGRSVLVLDAEDAGYGCSSRNGGQISTSIKPGLEELTARYGEQTAKAILRTGHDALQWIGGFVDKEEIDCDFMVPGRFHAAHNQRQFDKLAHAAEHQPEGFKVPVRIVPRHQQRDELGTDTYFGGVVFESHASLEPARYHGGLLARVLDAGARVAPHCIVTGIEREADGRFEVVTSKGRVKARDVVVATNGYTGTLTPWLRRRVIPIGSYMIATEALPAELMDKLMPKNRIVSDTRKVVYYYRPSPDRTRIIFGGRVSASETNPERSGPLLLRDLRAIFPELEKTRISHSWMGFVAYTFNTLPHIGEHDGVHYATGYCGTGVSLASYLGMKLGRRILGVADAATGLEEVTFETRPLYTGSPWFLSASVAWYRFLDGLKI